jgi:hypothetical protein
MSFVLKGTPMSFDCFNNTQAIIEYKKFNSITTSLLGSQSAEICCCGEAPGNDNKHNLCIQNGGHCSDNKQDRERERLLLHLTRGLAAHD